MERVGALIHKLKELYDQNVDKKNLLITVQLLLAELEQENVENISKGKVSVVLPKVQRIVLDVPGVEAASSTEFQTQSVVAESPVQQKAVETEREIPETIKSYVLKPPSQPVQPVRLTPPQPEITEQKADAPTPQTASAPVVKASKKEEQSGWLFDPANEKTVHQKEVYELNDVHIDGDSLNDKLKETKTEVGTSIKADTVIDLRKAIGINDRYRFINELFRGDEDMYERSIKTINGFSSMAEAETWIQRELKVKVGWNENNATVKDFDQVVKRRFS